MARLAIDDHNPDIVTIICCNDGFQLALDHNTIKILLRVCKRARPLLSSKMPRFHRWCQSMELLNLEGHLRIGLTPSDQIALSLHFEDQAAADRSWLVAQAEQGNAVVSYFLARTLQVEFAGRQFVRASEREATHSQIFHHLKRAAKASHSMAQFHLAECYRNRLGVDQDHNKAAELYRSLADCGIPQAQIALGRCYENGEGVDQDFDVAIEWYSKAIDQGGQDGRLHIVFLRGWLSFIGHSVEQSDVNALNHWQEVSTQSTDPIIKPIATHMVGWMHYLGRGTFFQFCQMGSDQDWLCSHLMAVCLLLRDGTKEEQKKSAGTLEQLANDGHSDSQFWIGMCYHFGWGASEDYEKSFEWFSKSADKGNSYGQWSVGVCHYWGYGVTQNHAKAFEWLHKSAEQGNRQGQYRLGECYRDYEYMPEDIDAAVLWLRKAADQDFQPAIDSLKELGKWH
ncbi:uncharacterized protein BJ171DRAFT_628823 [Polychytrium aggregatum]|uniref:uncharacterized protein n=1 Tax=Polychytrium aggregatum TaxID=110093 RepID=UPI0022FE05A2|nr:uncharacterized protein BJ171DRAFT_628823 [Polychytrium aggregatum]KAI9183752.1 hypothetical protein BJ171DRAFT_628823 [Polychytrium aggregatum]